MIFKKDVTFPYPILAPFNDDYPNKDFSLEVTFQESSDQTYFDFEIRYAITSSFLSKLIQDKKVKIKCIIQSHDSQIYDLEDDDRSIRIPQKLISLKKRTNIQLALVAKESISFDSNKDLDAYYDAFRSQINVEPHHLLALSNTVNFNGELKRPYDLFKYSFKENLESEIEFDTSGELIHIKFKDRDFLYKQAGGSNALNFHYVYMGLEKALAQFIFDNSDGSDSVNINDVALDQGNLLHEKLRLFMIGKGIQSISLETIERTIEAISESIISKHNQAILRRIRYES